MSSIIANSGEEGGRPAEASCSGAIRVSALPNSLRPSELASRRAGSIVQTNAPCPWTALHRARLAATVVFPTPPAPTQTSTRRCASA